MSSAQVTAKHIAVDELPGGVPTLWHIGDGFITVLMSRKATADQLASSFDLLYQEMAREALTLVPVAEVA